MQSAKEAASNVAASAKSGMDKTKATVQEKVEKITSHNPVEKDMATHRKQEKIDQAELNKQAAHDHNAAARQQHSATTGHTTATGMNPMHGTGTGTTTTTTTGHTGHTTNPTMGGGYNQGAGGGYTH